MPTLIAGRVRRANLRSWLRSGTYRSGLAGHDGMTLIELLVAMAVVGIMLAVVVGGVRDFMDAEMKSEANKLASTIRYLYNKAVTDRLYLRIVYDFESQTYHVESTAETFAVAPENLYAPAKKDQERSDAEAKEDAALRSTGASFGAVDDFLLKPVNLGTNIYFKDIETTYLPTKIQGGKAYTYFFPNGFATPTMIHLTDEDDEIQYSLEVLAFSGRVRIYNDYRELQRQSS